MAARIAKGGIQVDALPAELQAASDALVLGVQENSRCCGIACGQAGTNLPQSISGSFLVMNTG